jgi:aspartokinase
MINSMSEPEVKKSVEQVIWLCAERGWRVDLVFQSGEKLNGVFITATDQENKAIALERAGERQKQPRLVFLKELASAEAVWKSR